MKRAEKGVRPLDDRISYLNTDLELASLEDLSGLAAALDECGMGIHYVGRASQEWCANLDMDTGFGSPEQTIAAILGVVEALPQHLEVAWNGCTRRELNIGYECGSKPSAFEQPLSNALLTRVVAAGASLVITIYPNSPDALPGRDDATIDLPRKADT